MIKSKRRRTSSKHIYYLLELYFSENNHVAIWKWVQRYASLTDRFRIIDKHKKSDYKTSRRKLTNADLLFGQVIHQVPQI
ncbi:MAG TPA: hypothetical protein VE593_09160 [Nitrososphaeraceae archaeon]|nr:hypothetical protein [Nitrososphaeraceae archaeon]